MKRIHTVMILILMLAVIPMSVQAVNNRLDIDKVTVEVDGDHIWSGTGSSGTMYVEPDSELEFEIKIENMWDRDNEDAERINNIVVYAVLYDIDDGDDLSYTSSRFDLRPEGYKTVRFDFDVPDDVESDQNYELEIEVRGEDESGEEHSDEMSVSVEVERDAHELVFEDVQVSDPQPCSDIARVHAKIVNEGEHDEEGTLRIESAFKGVLYEKDLDVEAFDEDDNEYTFTRTIDVSGFPQGSFDIDFLLEFDDEELTESETLRIPYCDERDGYYDGSDDKEDDEDNKVERRYYYGQYEYDTTEYDVPESVHDERRSRNAELFRQIDKEPEVSVKFVNTPYIPPASEFVDESGAKKSEWGTWLLVAVDIILLIVAIVALVVIAQNIVE